MDAQDGDVEAMDRLFRQWQKRLWGHAYRLTGNSDAAWDISQHGWVDIIKGLRHLKDPACFGTWAYRIITYKAINWIKRQKRFLTLSNHIDVSDIQTTNTDDSLVNEILQKIEISKRTVLTLYYFEQLTVAEIGALLKIPAGTVKSRLHAAREAFRVLWKNATEPNDRETENE